MQRVHPALVPLALAVGLLACAAPAAPAPAAAPSPAGAAASGAPPAAAAAPTSAPTARPAPVTLKVGDLRINSSAGTYIALERGYFAEQGITLDFEPFTTGGEQIPALANGQLDIGVGAVSAALYNAVGRGVPIKLVVDQGRHVPGRTATAFVVRTDLWDSGAIREPADLRGRPVGISSTASTPEILVDRALQRGGLTILLIEHDMPFVMGLCNERYVFDFGSLIAQGKPAEIRAKPVVLDAYLGSEAFAAFIKTDNERISKVLKDVGLVK